MIDARWTATGNVSGRSYRVRVSLTAIIDDNHHPLAGWFPSRLPRTAKVRASYAGSLPVRRVQRPVAAGRTVVRWDLLGTAIDFRIRCAFVPTAPPSAVAGALLAGNLGGDSVGRVGRDLVEAFDGHLRETGAYIRERRWVLDQVAEARLDRLCFALAWFDRFFRDGELPAGTPLADPAELGGVEPLLACVPDYAVMDMQVMVRLAEVALGQLRDSTDEGTCWTAPTFAGSADVGGADADLIIGRRLLEIKSVSHPEFLGDKAIWQLAGYVLLDYDDRYRINEVGFYMSRIGWLATWPVEEFFRLLGCRESLPRLRAAFAATCTARMPQRPPGRAQE
jgi:hypothetical protein